MINTKMQQHSSYTKLHLIDLNIADVRQSSFERVKKELVRYQNSDITAAYITVGLNDAYNIVVEGTDMCFAQKRISYLNLIKNRTINEITERLITNYTKFLQQQYKYQSNINDKELHKLLSKNPGSALFSAYDLADYLIDNLGYIDGVLLQDFRNHVDDDSSLYNYLMKGILVRLPEIDTIKSSTINNIQNLLSTKCPKKSISDVIMINLYKIITHHDHEFSINFDEPIQYCVLLNMLPENMTKKHIEMPLSALPDLTVTMTDTTHRIKYKVFNQDILQTFIDELLNSPDLATVKHMIELGLNIELSTNDNKNISKMIRVINSTFSHSNRLQNVAQILQIISN